MRNRSLFLAWVVTAVLGSAGCGGVEDVQPQLTDEQGAVEQMVYNARCETNAQGYQTGRCIKDSSLTTCQPATYTPPNTTCAAGIRPTGTKGMVSAQCGIYLNNNYCQDPILLPF